MSTELSIHFEGAAQTVTGSRHRIRLGDRTWLFDCGLHQGHRDEAETLNRTFRFDPATLDAVVLSHAHLDHTGNLPTLVGRGYSGRIHATGATADLVRVLLPDTAFLMEREVEMVNRRARGKPPRHPLYTQTEVGAAVSALESHDYHQPWNLLPGVEVQYFDAGHILGSALTRFDISAGGRKLGLGMSGDLGRSRRPILRDPETISGVDALVLESTYGDRLHPPAGETETRLAELVRLAESRRGRLLIPSFAVGRTQEVVATIHRLCLAGQIPDLPIFVDSPMAKQATEVFRHHPECFDAETRNAFLNHGGEPFGFARLRYVSTREESQALNNRSGPFIVVSASGMCEGGRILHHLRHGLPDPKNLVALVGFQAEGTLGRRLLAGAEVVNILGEPVPRRAEIHSLEGFSAHADRDEILEWVGRMNPVPRRIFLVHGEKGAAEALSARLKERFNTEVHVPAPGQRFDLWS